MSRARTIANYGNGIDTSSITSGTFADARIAASNVTQHEGSIDALASNPTIALGSNATFPTDHVIQVEHTVNGTGNLGSTTGTYPQASGFKLSITPKQQTSKILVIFNADVWISEGTNQGNKISKFGIRLNSQSNATVADKRFSARDLGTAGDMGGELTLIYLDDHDSTNSQEYELVMGRWSDAYDNSVTLNGGGFGKSTITLMEIA